MIPPTCSPSDVKFMEPGSGMTAAGAGGGDNGAAAWWVHRFSLRDKSGLGDCCATMRTAALERVRW